jgi:hypothetical protein
LVSMLTSCYAHNHCHHGTIRTVFPQRLTHIIHPSSSRIFLSKNQNERRRPPRHIDKSHSDHVNPPMQPETLTPYLLYQSVQHRLEHLKILLRPPREPSRLESLPTEILVQIARSAHDAHIKASIPTGNLRVEKCRCCNEPAASGGKHVKMAKEVLSLGATSRRIRAVLIHAGFFGSISLKVDADQLFATNAIATDGFLEGAK